MFASFIRVKKMPSLTLAVVYGLLFWALFAAPRVYAQPVIRDSKSGTPWHLKAAAIAYDKKTDEYTATGNVQVLHGNERLSADTVRFNRTTMQAHAKGNVQLTVGGDRLNGDRLDLDLSSGTGTLYNGLIFIKKNHFYIRGEKIRKTGEATYEIKEAELTSCDGRAPAWHITGRSVDVTLEGYGTVKDAALWIRKFPILYTPYFLFPAKSSRQSGLLAPQIGYSTRLGARFALPYFWAINRNTDATLYYEHMQYRGEKLGVEYRYVINDQSRGTLMADGFRDRKIDDGTDDTSSKWGYTDDNYLRTNRSRYWFRGKLNQALFDQVSAKLDFDIVSDQDYLREFSDGYTGYNASRKSFIETFGRDIDDINDPIRTNRLNLNRTWARYTLNTNLVWYDDANRGHPDSENPLQRLPDIMFDALRQPVPGTPVYTSLTSEYTYLYRQDEARGHRIDIHPEFYLPLRIGRYGTFEPRAGFRQTAWYMDSAVSDRPENARYYHRELYDLGAELSSNFYRVFSVDIGNVKKIEHMVIPKIEYSYVPRTKQSEYPYFDDVDRIDSANQITFSITQLLTSKRTTASAKNGAPAHTYNQFCRFRVAQRIDLEKIADPTRVENPLTAELDITPKGLLTLHADVQWENARRLETGSLSCRLTDKRKDRIGLNYTYSRDFVQSIGANFSVPVGTPWRITGDYERNVKDNKTIRVALGVRYAAQCWAVNLVHVDEENDHKYEAMVELTGLGGFGNTP